MTCHGDGREADQITRAIGRYRGLSVHLSVRANPSLDARAPEEFAVNLFLALPDGANVDVARIDTSHDGVHYDRLYLPADDPLWRDYSIDVVDYRDAQRKLLEDWREHVEAYAETHGLPSDDVSRRR
mgnify:CR=1 FL=1